MSSYWLGVATVPVVVGAGYALIWLVANAVWELGQRGWFFETGGVDSAYETPTWHATRRVRTFLRWFHWTTYGTDEFGSRSLTVGSKRNEGHGVAIGYKSLRFARTKKEQK